MFAQCEVPLFYSKVNPSAQVSEKQPKPNQSPIEKSNLIWSVIADGKPRSAHGLEQPQKDQRTTL